MKFLVTTVCELAPHRKQLKVNHGLPALVMLLLAFLTVVMEATLMYDGLCGMACCTGLVHAIQHDWQDVTLFNHNSPVLRQPINHRHALSEHKIAFGLLGHCWFADVMLKHYPEFPRYKSIEIVFQLLM